MACPMPVGQAPIRADGVERGVGSGYIHRVPEDPNAKSLLDLAVQGGAETVIKISGDLDPATAPALEAALADAVADPEVSSIAVDLSGLTFLDSSGLRVFVVAREAMRAREAAFTLRSPSANVRRLLDVTGLGEVIEIQ